MFSALPADLHELAAQQGGVLTRRQLVEGGVGDHLLQGLVRSGRWQLLHRGTYATFSGRPPRTSVLWAALLATGPGSVLSHRTAAELHGLWDEVSSPVHVTVLPQRRVRAPRGVRLHAAAHLDRKRQVGPTPPRTSVEETVLDLVDTALRAEGAVDAVTRACQRRRTTPGRLAIAAEQRKKLRWRGLLDSLLADVASGAESPLELRYLHDVELAHRLPRAERQGESRWGALRRRDVAYPAWRLVVELDGVGAHPAEQAHRDLERDTLHALHESALTLRFGWHAVVADPCRVAEQVAAGLRRGGWTGLVGSCGPGCSVASRVPE